MSTTQLTVLDRQELHDEVVKFANNSSESRVLILVMAKGMKLLLRRRLLIYSKKLGYVPRFMNLHRAVATL
jgi:hypothetical protein